MSLTNPRGELKTATMVAIREATVKMNNMNLDVGNMFEESFHHWVNHREDLHGRVANIYAMINLGNKLGCDMSAETAAAAILTVPIAPLRFLN